MMIFCCMPPEKVEHVRLEQPSAGRSSRRISASMFLLPRAVAEAEAAMRAEVAEQQILAHGEVGHDALRAAILGDEAKAGAERIGRSAAA